MMPIMGINHDTTMKAALLLDFHDSRQTAFIFPISGIF
jgi:hypothetical protein